MKVKNLKLVNIDQLLVFLVACFATSMVISTLWIAMTEHKDIWLGVYLARLKG